MLQLHAFEEFGKTKTTSICRTDKYVSNDTLVRLKCKKEKLDDVCPEDFFFFLNFPHFQMIKNVPKHLLKLILTV